MGTFEENDDILEPTYDQKFRVLLASHNDLVCLSLTKFFENSEFSLSLASDRQEAVAKIESEDFDIVIANFDTRPYDVFLFRDELRRNHKKLPLVVMTPLFNLSDSKLLGRITEDPHSYYIPENADCNFMLAKLRQVIKSYQLVSAVEQLQGRINRSWLIAKQLQQAMLPPWVYFGKNYEFSFYYRPFAKVSGDLFEWLPLGEDQVLFIFGDISGHGTHSALAMTAVQSFLKQIVLLDQDEARQPAKIAADINDFFCTHLSNIVYMCSLIAYIDFKKNYLCYQNAGYVDITCVNAETGEFEEINPENRGSLPLGMMSDTVYTEDDNVEYHFSDSSVFLFSSDGLTDLAKNREGTSYLDVSLCRKLSAILVTEAQKDNKSVTVPFRVYHQLEQFGYTFPQDDLTMVMIRKPRCLEKEYVFSRRVPADKKAVDEICETASGFISEFYHDEVLSVNTELLLEEYLENVVLHGLSEYEKLNDYIAVKICAYEKEVRLIIWDHGKEWNALFLSPQKADQSLDHLNDNLLPNGRGVPIISKIASQISRQRYCGLNESIFIIRVGDGESENS